MYYTRIPIPNLWHYYDLQHTLSSMYVLCTIYVYAQLYPFKCIYQADCGFFLIAVIYKCSPYYEYLSPYWTTWGYTCLLLTTGICFLKSIHKPQINYFKWMYKTSDEMEQWTYFPKNLLIPFCFFFFSSSLVTPCPAARALYSWAISSLTVSSSVSVWADLKKKKNILLFTWNFMHI